MLERFGTVPAALKAVRQQPGVGGARRRDPRHSGTNQLLRDGAHLVESAADVLAILAPMLRHAGPPTPRALRLRRASSVEREPVRAAAKAAPGGAKALAERVAQVLGPSPLAVDELIRECNAAPSDVQAALLELELAGRIDRQTGNRVALRAD